MPVLRLANDNVRGLIPTTLKYTLALIGKRFTSDFMHFHRIEPTLATWNWSGDKTLFIHNDIHQQMVSPNAKQAILWRRFPKAYFALEQRLIQQFNQVFSCNSESALHYQQQYPAIASKVSLIRNTVDNEVFYALPEAEQDQLRVQRAHQMGLPEDTKFILFAGRLHPQKDPLLLVNAIAALQSPNAHLLIAGHGELADPLKAEIERLGQAQRITLLGAVNPAELAHLHRLSSVFVLTSSYEGLPLVVLEALACGTPIVTTQCGETPKLLTPESGLVCSDRSPSAIADALQEVLHHPERYPSHACIQAAQPYSASDVIHSVYHDMLQRWQP
jgi:glycosyltransferase involved in cell wall biosynthesis